MVLKAVDTEFTGHEVAKSPVCSVWCGSRLCSPGISQTASTAGAQDPYWGGIALGCIAASESETEGAEGWGHGKREGHRYLAVTSWPHIPRRHGLYALRVHWMPHAERDVLVKKGKIDRKHMAGAELQGLVACYSSGLAELLGLQV